MVFALVRPDEASWQCLNDWQCASFQEFVTLKDTAMDLTLEDWEELELELDKRDLFWDLTLSNCQDFFLLSKCHLDLGFTGCCHLMHSAQDTTL